MKQFQKRFAQRCEGMIAVEACVGMTLFMMLMLALYSLIPLFMAQSLIGHALIETCESMALETYGTSVLEDGDMQIKDIPIGIVKIICGVGAELSDITDPTEDRASFASSDRWFDFHGSLTPLNDQVIAAAKRRFAGYLAGSEAKADALLEGLGVEGGMSGLDFDGTTLDGSDLTISIRYKISLLIRLERFGLGTFDAGQRTCSRIWGSA